VGSLRARILWGAVLWTLGLFIGTMLVATAVMIQYRPVAVVLHGTADSHGFLGLVVVLAFLFAGFVQMRKGLSSFRDLRERLARVHAGQADLADALASQIQGMQRQIDYHLAQARAAASGATPGATSAVRASAEALARTLERLHAARGVRIQVDVDPAHAVRVQREDLDEMLGNLLDNACKWTRGKVAISSTISAGIVTITVDDDGAGVPALQRETVLQRGVKADEAAPGSGLGLAIVRDLAELYRGSLSLDDAPHGGLRARLVLPAAGTN